MAGRDWAQNDLARTLQQYVRQRGGPTQIGGAWDLMLAAADEIERLEEYARQARAEGLEAFKRLRELLDAFDSGNLEMNSPEIGGEDGIPPHPWHEEWLHYIRALAQQDALAKPQGESGPDYIVRHDRSKVGGEPTIVEHKSGRGE